MKTLLSITTMTIVLLVSAQALAKDHGFVTSIRHDVPAENVFRVNIEKVDGKEHHTGVNVRVTPGTHSIEVSLVFNSKWASSMNMTQGNIYIKIISMEIETDKTYYLGAKVNTHASESAQKDGSFWEPMVYETR